MKPSLKREIEPQHTAHIYGELQTAYAHYNKEIFDNRLPQVVITLCKKSPKTRGYFISENWENETLNTGAVSELALNPSFLAKRTVTETLSTLVHEMVHCWQQYEGTTSRGGYHNKEWGSKMQDIGLMPSTTGKADGKRTGQSVSHFIIASEITLFNRATAKLFKTGWIFDWKDHYTTAKKKSGKSKIKYECPDCGARCWGKEGLSVRCTGCEVELLPVD